MTTISMQVLPKGDYYLVVRSNIINKPIKFTLDIVRKIEALSKSDWMTDFVDAI